MALYLTVHARYKDVQWGLFEDGILLCSESVESKKMSKQFIILLDSMLRQNNLTLKDLSFIAVHQGPAPFTTLRVCLSAVNGIGFATGLPLVGVNGLDAILDEHALSKTALTVALLNAFANDVYYAIADHRSDTRCFGYAPGEEFLASLKKQYSESITFLGNGCTLHEDTINRLFGSQAQIVPIDMVSLEKIAHCAYEKWRCNETNRQLMPVYLKDYSKITIEQPTVDVK